MIKYTVELEYSTGLWVVVEWRTLASGRIVGKSLEKFGPLGLAQERAYDLNTVSRYEEDSQIYAEFG